ncbi:MAG: GMP/IMP nucleotidase [Pseudomonadales bacterium]|jgi:putative hydrolase of the HAD superfamily
MLDWNQIDTVLLDMDGTLLDLHFDTYFWLTHVPEKFAEKNALTHEQAYREILKRVRAHEGTLNFYCLDFWSDNLQLDIAGLKHDVSHKIAYRPQVTTFLEQVREHRKRCVIVTNAHRDSLDLKLAKTGLHENVDAIFCSHDFRMPKEAPDFWENLQHQEPFLPAATLLIDDSVAVLRSAREYGIAHLLTISQPDSQQPRRDCDEFPSLDDFGDILPNRNEVPAK